MAGMLHDVGQIVLALADRNKVAAVTAQASETQTPLYVVERELFQVTHAEVGAYILGTWGVPFGIVEAVAGHHEPRRLGNACFDTMMAVHVAEGLVAEVGPRTAVPNTILDKEHLESLGLLKDLPAWTQMATRLCEDARD